MIGFCNFQSDLSSFDWKVAKLSGSCPLEWRSFEVTRIYALSLKLSLELQEVMVKQKARALSVGTSEASK